MKYWKQFAEILGLELGEEFVLKDSDGERIDAQTYKFTENGFLYKKPPLIGWSNHSLDTIGNLLQGYVKAVPKPWKPQNGKQYWYYYSGDGAVCAIWKGSTWDLHSWKIGNCFRTEKEAWDKGQKLIQQIKKEFEEA